MTVLKKGYITFNHFYKFYKDACERNVKKRKRLVADRTEVQRIQSLLWKTVAEHYINNIGGVYLDDIGYLCHIIRPNRNFVVNKKLGIIKREKTDGYLYKHFVLRFKAGNKYFNLKINNYLVLKCNKFIQQGNRYRFLYREVKAKKRIVKKLRILRIYKDNEFGVYKKDYTI